MRTVQTELNCPMWGQVIAHLLRHSIKVGNEDMICPGGMADLDNFKEMLRLMQMLQTWNPYV